MSLSGFPATCFAPLARSSSISLPPNKAEDTYEGRQKLWLEGSTSPGLHILLKVVQSLLSVDPITVAEVIARGGEGVIGAAMASRRYELLFVPHSLCQVLSGPETQSVYLTYGIWAVLGDEERTAAAAKRAVSHDITEMDEDIYKLLRENAVGHLVRLQDFRLRQLTHLPRFHRYLPPSEHNHPRDYHGLNNPCDDTDLPDVIEARTRDKLLRAETVEAVLAIDKRDFDLRCDACIEGADNYYGPMIRELVDAAGTY